MIDDDELLPDFPILTKRDLYLITMGHYQINQAKSYYGEHISTDGKFRFEVCSDPMPINFTSNEIVVNNPIFIKATLHSLHMNRTNYFI